MDGLYCTSDTITIMTAVTSTKRHTFSQSLPVGTIAPPALPCIPTRSRITPSAHLTCQQRARFRRYLSVASVLPRAAGVPAPAVVCPYSRAGAIFESSSWASSLGACPDQPPDASPWPSWPWTATRVNESPTLPPVPGSERKLPTPSWISEPWATPRPP